MRPAPELSVVIPTFNEVKNVSILIDRLREVLAGVQWEAIFVDDNSPDGTAREVRRIAATDQRIRCIRRIGRRGLAGACIEGMLSSQATYIAIMDSDLQHDETVLAAMLRMIKTDNLDLVVASRYLDGHAGEGFSRSRSQFSAIATRIAAMFVGKTLTDPMSGFFVVRRSVFEELAPRLSSQGFKILLDVVTSSPTQLRIGELPYVFRERVHGESKLDSQVVFTYVTLLLAKLSNDLVSVRFLLFCLIGLSGIGVHMSALSISLWVGNMSFDAAQAIATLSAITSNFFLNNLVTYRDLRLRGSRLLLGWLKFVLICSIGAVSNIGIANWFYEQHAAWEVAGFAGAIISVFWNFMVSAIFVWRLR